MRYGKARVFLQKRRGRLKTAFLFGLYGDEIFSEGYDMGCFKLNPANLSTDIYSVMSLESWPISM